MTLPTDPKLRKEIAMWTFLTEYFPDAFEAVVAVAVAGNRQHNPGERLHWSRGKSTDQMDTAFRHMWDHKFTGAMDVDGCYHLAKSIWRLSAELQLHIEGQRAQTSCAGSLLGAMPGVANAQHISQATPIDGSGSARDEAAQAGTDPLSS